MTPLQRRPSLAASLLACLVSTAALPASAAIQVLTLTSSRDATIYGDPTFRANGNGSGEGLFAGNNGNGFPRRSMLEFDLAAIDPGATILDVSLSLFADRAPNARAQTVSLHRLTADWGEGPADPASMPGQGVAARPGDTTWLYRYFGDNSRKWSGQGATGDFVSAASGAASVTTEMAWYTWSATGGVARNAGMIADVQMWVRDPDANFGWLLKGNEAGTQTVKRFASHELARYAPRLTIRFDLPAAPLPVPEPGVPLLLAAGLLLTAVAVRRARRMPDTITRPSR